MGARKMNEEFYEIETQSSDDSDYCATDPTSSSAKKKNKEKKKKKNIMQLESKEKGASRKPNSLKSKNKQGSDNSKKSTSNARKRTRYSDLYEDKEAKFSVMERADRVLAFLENKLPHFVKCMLPSNVAHGFWLHLPKKFCSAHLPNHDTSVVLVDEWGNEYKTSYLLERHGLSAGWRGFSISHRLLKGDVLIFHLTAPCKFKVHIVRVNGEDVVGAALCLMNMEASGRGTFAEDNVRKDDKKRKKTKYVEPFLFNLSSPPENVEERKGPNLILAPVADQSATNSNGCSQVIEEISNQSQSNDFCLPKTSFLRVHTREGVTCR